MADCNFTQKTSLIIAITVLVVFTRSFAFSETIRELVIRDGVYFKKFSDTPFSGKVIGESQGVLKGGKWDGMILFFHPNGQLRQKGVFKSGKKVGLWTNYFESGLLFSKGHYKDGKRNGLWEANLSSFFPENRLRPDLQVRYKDGVIVGKCQVFPGNSGFCNVKWGQKGGVSIVRKGLWVDRFENGVVRSEGKFESGMKTGLWKEYFENGRLKSKGRYFKGLNIGPWEGYYDNGQVKYKGSYIDKNTVEKLSKHGRFDCSLNDTCKLGVWFEFLKNGDVKTVKKYIITPDVKG